MQVEARHLLKAFVQSAEQSHSILHETAAASPSSWSLTAQAVHRIRISLDSGHGVSHSPLICATFTIACRISCDTYSSPLL